MSEIEYKIKALDVGRRCDAILAENFTEFSRASWQSSLTEHSATIDGISFSANSKIKASQVGEIIKVQIPVVTNRQPSLSAPKVLPEIIYEDKDVIVINKPAGLLTHPTEKSTSSSVAGAFASKVDDSDSVRPGIVHRLDRDTSGVMILAKNQRSKEFLQSQFKNRSVEKHYIALVEGRLDKPEARIELPIERSKKSPNKMAVASTGKSAISEYRTLANYLGSTLLDVNLLTGRTHQIRAQFAHIDHPVVGDTIYGKAAKNLERQFLHSASLSLNLPSTNKRTFNAPLPNDLADYLENIK